MGGSSLCPEVLAESFGQQPGAPRLRVLDSTDPTQVASVERQAPSRADAGHRRQQVGLDARAEHLQRVLLERMAATVGAAQAGRHFVAITDPGSKLEAAARRDGFRRVFAGVPSIGGRYSALSPFGLVPAAAMGLDLGRWLASASAMAEACRGDADVPANPGVALGLVLGTCARAGHRQAHADRLAAHLRSRRMARAADRRVDRQERPCHHPGGPRADRLADGLRRRPRLRLRPSRQCARRRAGCRRRSAGLGRPAGAARRRRRTCTTLGGRVLPLGDRHGGRRRGDGHQSLQSARRRGQQNRDAQADRRRRRRPGSCPPRRQSSSTAACACSPMPRTPRRCRQAAGEAASAAGLARTSTARHGRLPGAAGLSRR